MTESKQKRNVRSDLTSPIHYVGARYVPSWYDLNDGNWEDSTPFQALVIVRWNDHYYISKKPVPNTVGEPQDNPEYWKDMGESMEKVKADLKIYTDQKVDEAMDEANPVLEVSDTVTENATSGFEKHDLSETTRNGTKNEVGSAIIASKQVTDITVENDSLNVKTVDQSGKEETASHEVVTPATLQEVENEIDEKIGLAHLSFHYDGTLDNNAVYDINATVYLKAVPAGIYRNELINNISAFIGRTFSESNKPYSRPIIKIYGIHAAEGGVGFNLVVQTFNNSNITRIDFDLAYLNKAQLEIDYDKNNGTEFIVTNKTAPFIPTIEPNTDSGGRWIATINAIGTDGKPTETDLYNCIRSSTDEDIYKITLPNANFTKGIYAGYSTVNSEALMRLRYVLTPLAINATNNACLISFTKAVDNVSKPFILLVFCWAKDNDAVSNEFTGFGNLNSSLDVDSTFENVNFTKLV